MGKVALFVFNGDPMCFFHVLLNALDLKEKGVEARIGRAHETSRNQRSGGPLWC